MSAADALVLVLTALAVPIGMVLAATLYFVVDEVTNPRRRSARAQRRAVARARPTGEQR